MPRCQRGRDSMPAVADEVSVTVTDQPNRRRLTTALEPLTVTLDRCRAQAACLPAAEPNVGDWDPVQRCERPMPLRMRPSFLVA